MIFSLGSNGACKNELFQFTCLQPHLYIKIYMPHTQISTRKWQTLTSGNILTSSDLNTMSFSTICIFREYVTWKVVC